MKKNSAASDAIITGPSWDALNALHGMYTSHLARKYRDEQSLYTYMAPLLCAPNGRILMLEVVSHPDLFRRQPGVDLVDAMARHTKDLLTPSHPALRRFVKHQGFTPNVIVHVAEVVSRPMIALERLPAELSSRLADDMVMVTYYTRVRSVVTLHPLVRVDESRRREMEPQPFPEEGATTGIGGRLAIHA